MPDFNFNQLAGTEISAAIIIFNILLSFALQLLIVWIYKRTHRGLSYSQSFLSTIIIIGVLGTMIMMTVQHNLIGAFALLGAFSLIRFRTILKETRDIAFVFFALAAGVAVGTNNYSLAIIGSIMLAAIIYAMWKYNLGINVWDGAGTYVITLETSREIDINRLKEQIKLKTRVCDVLHAKYNEERGGHYAFSVKLANEDTGIAPLENVLKNMSGVKNLEIITTKHSVEY